MNEPAKGRRWRVLGSAGVLLVIIAAGALTPSPAAGAVRTWTGLGLTTNWNEALNWSGSAVPGAADTAIFDGTSSKAATLNVNVNIAGLSDRRRSRR